MASDGGPLNVTNIPAYLEAPPSVTGAPPVETRPQELPFGDIAWEDFERLCYRLACLEGRVKTCRQYGVAGQD